jgi:hypothetical protein
LKILGIPTVKDVSDEDMLLNKCFVVNEFPGN